MKVLHLISGGDTGGAKTHIISLIKGIDSLINVKIICFIEDTFYIDAKKEGIDIEVYKQKSRSDLSVVSDIANVINNQKYDIVHCHGARANFIGMFLKSKIKVPMITTVHSDYKLDFKDNFYKKIVFTTLNTIALKKFKYYIAVSDTFKDMLEERGFKKENIFTVYNGIDINKEIKSMEKINFLKKYNIEYNGETIIGILARLDKVKNHTMFINACKKILDTRDDILFLIGGDGEQESNLKTMVSSMGLEKNIKFLGFVNAYDFLNAIDINVLTSLSESFPYSILEGAVMKKTIVSTDVGGIHKLIENDVNGYLIENENADMLADKLSILINEKDKTVDMGINLYNKVKANYSSEAMAKKHIEIYEEVLNKWV